MFCCFIFCLNYKLVGTKNLTLFLTFDMNQGFESNNLTMFNYFAPFYRAGAGCALNQVEKLFVPPEYNFSINWQFVNCSDDDNLRVTLHQVLSGQENGQLDALLGVSCPRLNEFFALIGNAMNIPVIYGDMTNVNFLMAKNSLTVLSTTVYWGQLSSLFVRLLQSYGWKHCSLINAFDERETGAYFVNKCNNNGITIYPHYVDISFDSNDMQETLHEIQLESRSKNK